MKQGHVEIKQHNGRCKLYRTGNHMIYEWAMLQSKGRDWENAFSKHDPAIASQNRQTLSSKIQMCRKQDRQNTPCAHSPQELAMTTLLVRQNEV